MHFISTATILPALAGLAYASPIGERQVPGPQQPKTVYGVDPQKPFYLSAITAETEYFLGPSFLDMGNTLALTASEPDYTPTPRANFTLVGNHYGTQLYAYSPLLCTSPTGCPGNFMVQWSNVSPSSSSSAGKPAPLTFRQGVQQPTFGGLAFYGEYNGGDFAAGETNYLIGQQDSDFTKAWALCDYPAGTPPRQNILFYHGAGPFDAACKPVTVRAHQVPDAK